MASLETASPAGDSDLVQSGGQGYVCVSSHEGSLCATKHIKNSKKAAISTEIRVARRLENEHAHIVKVIQCVKEKEEYTLSMELGTCDLRDILDARPSYNLSEGNLVTAGMCAVKPENLVLFPYDRQATSGGGFDVEVESRAQLQKFRRKSLSAANLLCTTTPNFHPSQGIETLRGYLLKLCDWGCALVSPRQPLSDTENDWQGKQVVLNGKSPRGSLPFACPHIVMLHILYSSSTDARTLWRDPTVLQPLVSAGYDAAAADVWSFGITLWVCVAGSTPWSVAGPSSRRFREYVRATQRHVLRDEMLAPDSDYWHHEHGVSDGSAWSWPSSFSAALVDLLGGCLKVRDSERLSMSEVMGHAWFRNPAWTPPAGEEAGNSMSPGAAAGSADSSDGADDDGDVKLTPSDISEGPWSGNGDDSTQTPARQCRDQREEGKCTAHYAGDTMGQEVEENTPASSSRSFVAHHDHIHASGGGALARAAASLFKDPSPSQPHANQQLRMQMTKPAQVQDAKAKADTCEHSDIQPINCGCAESNVPAGDQGRYSPTCCGQGLSAAHIGSDVGSGHGSSFGHAEQDRQLSSPFNGSQIPSCAVAPSPGSLGLNFAESLQSSHAPHDQVQAHSVSKVLQESAGTVLPRSKQASRIKLAVASTRKAPASVRRARGMSLDSGRAIPHSSLPAQPSFNNRDLKF